MMENQQTQQQQQESGEGNTSPQQSRSRNNSAKSKLLVRSHAMREEASPPREPTPVQQNSPTRLKGPLLTLPSSRNHSPIHPYLVVSESADEESRQRSTPPSPSIRISDLSPMPVSSSRYSLRSFPDGEEPYGQDDRPPRFNGRHNNNHNDERREISRGGIVEEGGDGGVVEQIVIRRNGGPLRVECVCGNNICGKCLRNFNNNNLNNSINNNNQSGTGNTLSVNRVGSRSSLRQQSSSQGSFESNNTNSPRLSRDNSAEVYRDTSGVDLVKFISDTLNKNMKDRHLMLKIEEELLNLCENDEQTHFKFPAMSSYQRMLVHRVAAYFGMDHNVELSGKSVVVNKTDSTRIPEVRFETYVRDDLNFDEEQPRRLILKRDSNSVDDYNFKSPDRQSSVDSRRSKSIEEREEEYRRARRRIFNNKEMREYSGSTDDYGWNDHSWSSMEAEAFPTYRLQPPDNHRSRLYKYHSEETHDDAQRPHVAKSYSFGGYGGSHARCETHNAGSGGAKVLTKQDSGTSSGISPSSSSGYKTQSQRSASITPSPTSLRQDSTATNTSEQISPSDEHQDIVWVRYNVNDAPIGKIIIDPQTLDSARNPDGTLYKFDPDNVPPNIVVHTSKNEDDAKSTAEPPVSSPPSNKGAKPKDGNNRNKKFFTKQQSAASRAVTSPLTSSSTCPDLVSVKVPAGQLPTKAVSKEVIRTSYPVNFHETALPLMQPNPSPPSYVEYNMVPVMPTHPMTSSQMTFERYPIMDPYLDIYNGIPPDGSNLQYCQPSQSQWGQPMFLPRFTGPWMYHSQTMPTQQQLQPVEGVPPPGPGAAPIYQGAYPMYVSQQQTMYPTNQPPPPPPPAAAQMIYANYNGYAQPVYSIASTPGSQPAAIPPQTPLPGQIFCQEPPPSATPQQQVNVLAQSFGQLSFGGGQKQYKYNNAATSRQKFDTGESSEASSPATTVIAGCYTRSLPTPTELQHFNFNVPPPTCRPANNVSSPPISRITNSRSPTPGEPGIVRYGIPSQTPSNHYHHYQPMQFVMPPEHRLHGHRSQANAIRYQRPQNYQNDNSRGRNNRRQK